MEKCAILHTVKRRGSGHCQDAHWYNLWEHLTH